MIIYPCNPDFEGILCGIYDAWMGLKGHNNVRLELKGTYQEVELFSEYVDVRASPEEVGKVTRSACKELSQSVYEKIYVVSLSQDGDRTDKIYRFLARASAMGPEILDQFQTPEDYELSQMCRNAYNENHLLVESFRFSQALGGMLVPRIESKNNVMTLLAPHFADRLPKEGWVIYDENREKAAVHPRGRDWMIVNHPMEQSGNGGIWQLYLEQDTDGQEYEDLWIALLNTIAIKERENLVCQRNHLPLRFRPYMTKFRK